MHDTMHRRNGTGADSKHEAFLPRSKSSTLPEGGLINGEHLLEDIGKALTAAGFENRDEAKRKNGVLSSHTYFESLKKDISTSSSIAGFLPTRRYQDDGEHIHQLGKAHPEHSSGSNNHLPFDITSGDGNGHLRYKVFRELEVDKINESLTYIESLKKDISTSSKIAGFHPTQGLQDGGGPIQQRKDIRHEHSSDKHLPFDITSGDGNGHLRYRILRELEVDQIMESLRIPESRS